MRKVSQLGKLSKAERQLCAELESGDGIKIADGRLPARGEKSRRVRASLVRLLLLGDDARYRLHESGLRIDGAWIDGDLDLEGCRIPRDIRLRKCRFDKAPVFRSAIIDNLDLRGSLLPGLHADRIDVRGDISLCNIIATQEVLLLGATLGGDLDCYDAMFQGEADEQGALVSAAFSAEGLKAEGYVYLSGVHVRGACKRGGAIAWRTVRQRPRLRARGISCGDQCARQIGQGASFGWSPHCRCVSAAKMGYRKRCARSVGC